jgi:hypothetical protein
MDYDVLVYVPNVAKSRKTLCGFSEMWVDMTYSFELRDAGLVPLALHTTSIEFLLQLAVLLVLAGQFTSSLAVVSLLRIELLLKRGQLAV